MAVREDLQMDHRQMDPSWPKKIIQLLINYCAPHKPEFWLREQLTAAAALFLISFLLPSPNGSNGSCFTTVLSSNALNGSEVNPPCNYKYIIERNIYANIINHYINEECLQ